jgi:hypothetical protein
MSRSQTLYVREGLVVTFDRTAPRTSTLFEPEHLA